jgi:hypothetical protein
LDIRKYSWYPNKRLEATISTYTVSPTPKRFDQPQASHDDEEMTELPQGSAVKPSQKTSSRPRNSVVNFDISALQGYASLNPEAASSMRRHTVVHPQNQLLFLKPIEENRVEDMDI